MTSLIDISGQRFGRLVAVDKAPRAGGHTRWNCVCDCGKTKVVCAQHLKRGATQSCGCLNIEVTTKRLTTHNETHSGKLSPEYRTWRRLKSRCLNPNNVDYHNYGGREIRVCGRWKNSFENFLADMGRRPSRKHSIDRIDPDGDYEPDNCRWETALTQGRNRSGVVITMEIARAIRAARTVGVKRLDLCAKYGISLTIIKNVISGKCWREAA